MGTEAPQGSGSMWLGRMASNATKGGLAPGRVGGRARQGGLAYRYTPHEVAVCLREMASGPADIDLALDIRRLWRRLDASSQALLLAYSQGYSERECARTSGIGGNPNRAFDRALRMLTGLINGDIKDVGDVKETRGR